MDVEKLHGYLSDLHDARDMSSFVKPSPHSLLPSSFLESYLPTLIFEPEESAFEHHDDPDRDVDVRDKRCGLEGRDFVHCINVLAYDSRIYNITCQPNLHI
jgi:hypothetical protein